MKINYGTWPEMLVNINSGRLFFWGAGKRLLKFLDFMDKENIFWEPENIIDNDKSKKHKKIEILGVEIQIIRWDEVLIKENEAIVIIITTADYYTILKQLEEECKEKNVYVITFEYLAKIYQKYEIWNKKLLLPLKRTNKPVIPKIIHYCWFGGTPIPKKNLRYIECWKRQCPDYEIKEWNESNYDVSKCLYMEQAWKSKYWAFVSDYARLDIVYEYGGIYLDTDVEILRNLDDLLYQEAYLGFESNLYVATGLGFGARKKHPIIREMRDDYNNRYFIEKDGTYNLLGCPSYQTACLKQHGLITNGQHQHIGNVTIYPASVLCSYASLSKMEIKTPYSYTIHHFDATWRNIE